MAVDKAQPKLDGVGRASQTPVQVIAVTGGKGGVGKTTIAVNLAASRRKLPGEKCTCYRCSACATVP